jgi:hypothetical protein
MSPSMVTYLVTWWPVLLLSPLVFLIGAVRKRIVLRAAALTIVGVCYLILLIMMIPAVVMWLADRPTRDVVIDRDQMLAGIRAPKGSELTTLRTDGKPVALLLSKDVDIDGIPAGKGTSVIFGLDDKVGVITTGRAWTYRGIHVPAASTVYMKGSNICVIDLSQATEIEGTLFPVYSRVAFPPFCRMRGGPRASLRISPSADTIVDGNPCRGRPLQVAFSFDERTMECYLARPFDRDGYKLAAGSLIRVLYKKGITGEGQGIVVRGTLRGDCELSGVTWPEGVSFQQLAGAGETGASFRYEVPSAVSLHVDAMLIEGPSTLEFAGDKLRSLHGHYTWRGKHYSSYEVGAGGQIQRDPE